MKKLYCEKCREYLARHKRWKCPTCGAKVQEIITRDPSKNKLRYLLYGSVTILSIMGAISLAYAFYQLIIVGV